MEEKTSFKPTDEGVKYFGLVGHANNPPDLETIVQVLEGVGLTLKFWRFGAVPIYLVRRSKAARLGELRKRKKRTAADE